MSNMRFDHEGMSCYLGEQRLVCDRRTLRIGTWETALLDMTHVRVSRQLHFLEISTTDSCKRWYIPQEQWDSDALHRLEAFLSGARAVAARDEGDPSEIPEELRKLIEP